MLLVTKNFLCFTFVALRCASLVSLTDGFHSVWCILHASHDPVWLSNAPVAVHEVQREDKGVFFGRVPRCASSVWKKIFRSNKAVWFVPLMINLTAFYPRTFSSLPHRGVVLHWVRRKCLCSASIWIYTERGVLEVHLQLSSILIPPLPIPPANEQIGFFTADQFDAFQ